MFTLPTPLGRVLRAGGQSAPVNTAAPTVTGTPAVGNTLTGVHGTYSHAATSYTYQWKRDGVSIGGATSQTYALVAADSATTITFVETPSNAAGGGAPATSAGVAIPFSPLSLSPAVWPDASAPAYQDVARATPATAANAPVGSVTDLGSGANHPAQATAGKRPLLRVAGKGGLNFVEFDGVNDFLATAAAVNLPQPCYFLFVMARRFVADQCLFDVSNGSSPFLTAFDDASFFGWFDNVVTQYGCKTSDWPSGQWAAIELLFDGASSELTVNGLAFSENSANPGASGVNQKFYLASRAGTQYFSKLKFGEAVVLSRRPSVGERAALLAYATAKWSLTVIPATTATVYAGTGALDYAAFPGLTVLQDGRLWCNFYRAASHVDDSSMMEQSYSSDGGVTWSSPTTVKSDATLGVRPAGHPLVLADGTLLCHYFLFQSPNTTGLGAVLRSTDSGVTWSSPSVLPIPVGDDWACPYGHFLNLGGGVLLLTVYAGSNATGHGDSLMYRSADSGVTWAYFSTIATRSGTAGIFGWNETAAVVLGSGSVLASLRCDGAGQERLYANTSATGGAGFAAAAVPAFGYGVSPCFLRLASGRILLASGYRRNGVNGVRVQASDDDGATWPVSRMLYLEPAGTVAGDQGYPSMAETSPGQVACVYYRTQGTGAGVYCARFAAADVE